MRISPINRQNFYGKTVTYNSSLGTKGIKNMNEFYPHSTIERMNRITPRNKVYFAAPMEFVPNDIKINVDYVVYDNEPMYPEIEDISKNYFETNRTNYRQKFEEIRDYFYRREMGGFASSNEAKYFEWQAAECIRLYDKAGDLRYKKETTEDTIKDLLSQKQELNAGIINTRKELSMQKILRKSIENHIKYLDALNNNTLSEDMQRHAISNEKALYSTAALRVNDALNKNLHQDSLENSVYSKNRETYPHSKLKYGKYADTVKVYDSIESALDPGFSFKKNTLFQRQIIPIEDIIKKFEGILKENSSTIDEMNSYINELKSKIASIDMEIKPKKEFIESCKLKLQPLFDELKGYYLKQGIKTVKK